MPNLNIKNVPQELYASLKERAQTHHRSLNSEVIVCLELTLHSPHMDSQKALERARYIRHGLSGLSLNDEAISRAKNEGRA